MAATTAAVFGTEVYPPMSLTTAMGSVLVGDATSDFRGFRILGRHPLSIYHLALLRSEQLPHGRIVAQEVRGERPFHPLIPGGSRGGASIHSYLRGPVGGGAPSTHT